MHGEAGAGRDPRSGRWAGTGQDRMRAARHDHRTIAADASTALGALDTLDALESEAIHIFREVAGEFDRPVILFSGGKDSTLLVHLAVKAFAPAPVPFPLLHVDTGHNFPEVIDFRDRRRRALGLRLEVAQVQDWIDDGRLDERADGTRNPLQTVPLLDSITEHRFDAVFGGGRRDEERARAKERIFSLRDAFGQWDPRNQRPELWNLYNGRHAPGEHVRVFPISNWTELDVWRYIQREDIELPSIYYAHEREVFQPRRHVAGRGAVGRPARRRGRSRARPCATGRSATAPAPAPSSPTARPRSTRSSPRSRRRRLTERGATRADDRLSEAAMEDRKREGYF